MKSNNAVENLAISTEKNKEDKTKNDDLNPEFTPPETKNAGPQKTEVPPISYFALFGYATRSDIILMTLGILCSVATGICQPLNTLLFGTLTGDMIKQAGLMENATDPEVIEKEGNILVDNITQFAIYNSLIGLAMLVFSYASISVFNFTALRQIFYIRGKFFQCTLNQDVSWYDVNQTGDFASRMSEDLIKLEEGIGEKVCMFIHYQVAFVSSLILAFVKGWELALICLTSFPVTMIAVGIVGKVTSKLARQEMSAYGIAGSIAEEVFSSIRTVIAFGGQSKEINRYNDKLVAARDINIKRNFFSGLGFGLLWFFIYGSYALAFWYGVGLVIADKHKAELDRVYDPGTMVTVFFSVMMGSMNFGISSPYFETFGVATGAGAKIFSVINNLPIINKAKDEGIKPSSVLGKINFNNVFFNYPSRPDVEILRGFTLTINPGETIALVGSSGCGKSTCVQLMQRFYDPANGSITLDDKDLRDFNLIWLRNQIGVVGQEPILFGTTIKENIRYGNLEATQEDIEKAAKKSNAHDFIQKLPKGYNTMVGERGAQLSGGQKQRIAIARALVREPTILLLDEATSALDTNSEAKVQAALDNASKECTTIIVAHRLSTVRNADKIVVVSEGQVVEVGTHDELMTLKGAYFKLVTMQVTVDLSVETSQSVENEDSDESILKRNISVVSAAMSDSDISREKRFSESEEFEVKEEKVEVSLMEIIRVNQTEWPQILIGCVSSVIMGAAMPVFAIIFGEIIGILADSRDSYVVDETNMYCIYFVIAGVVTGFSTFLQIWTFGIAGERLTMRLRGTMFESMLRQEIAWFDMRENGTGSLCSRLSTEAANVQGATGQRIGTILQSISTLILGVGLSMYYEWRLGLVALVFTPLILVATFLQGRIIKQANEEQNNMVERATKLAVEAIGNVRTVASLGAETKFQNVYRDELMPGFKTAKRNVHFRGIVFGLARSLMFFAYAACMYYGGILVRDDGLSFEKVFKVSQSLIMGTVSIANALAFAPNFQKGLESASKIFKLLNRESQVPDSTEPDSEEHWINGNIEYANIWFTYPSRPGVQVLRNLNLSVLQGKTIALVGPSGCGKSTLVQLLERFYDPDSGEISIDNIRIREMRLAKLRSQMGIVSQEPSLFDRTIEENIAYGDNGRSVPKAEVIEAAKKANIHNFISSLPLGYETRLGEKGTQLSGGQKQRVAIARALVRDPKILLLDEATSALDTESEKVVQDALDKAKQGRTCITIAHRLSTIQDADVICVINHGKIAEMGNHTQLLSQKGLYYQLHSLQGT